MVSFEQVYSGSWASGRSKAVAGLQALPAELERLHGIRFRTGRNELDSFQDAALRLPFGRLALFLCYDGAQDETTIEIDASDDPWDAVAELTQVLQLDDSAFTWTPDSLPLDQR